MLAKNVETGINRKTSDKNKQESEMESSVVLNHFNIFVVSDKML